MDELNMDSLDLPEMEHDYSDVPDASEGLDEPARTSPAFGAGEDLSDIEMPVLSEMDGSAPVQPVKAEPQKQAPVQASVQTSAQISEMGGVSPMGGISEMGASSNNTSATGSPAANSMTGTASVSGISEMGASSYSAPKRNVQPAAPVSGGYTPVSGGTASTGTQNNGAASYSSVYNRNDQGSVQRTNDFFAATEQMNAEKYERGQGKGAGHHFHCPWCIYHSRTSGGKLSRTSGHCTGRTYHLPCPEIHEAERKITPHTGMALCVGSY